LEDAKKIIDAWFKERQEVKEWQTHKQEIAKNKGWTETILGRKRNLKEFFAPGAGVMKEGMGNRRAINTPIQGSAADIVNSAMVKIARNPRLK